MRDCCSTEPSKIIMQQLTGQRKSYNVYIHDCRFQVSHKKIIISNFANHHVNIITWEYGIGCSPELPSYMSVLTKNVFAITINNINGIGRKVFSTLLVCAETIFQEVIIFVFAYCVIDSSSKISQMILISFQLCELNFIKLN